MDWIPIYLFPKGKLGGCQMRISVADSLMRGFKKWSDAQDAKDPTDAVAPAAGTLQRRQYAATDEEFENGSS